MRAIYLLALLPMLPSALAALPPGVIERAGSDVSWRMATRAMPKGALVTALQGNPERAGTYSVWLMLPAGYRIGPHWHSLATNFVVLSGGLYVGYGNTVKAGAADEHRNGAYLYLPPATHHYLYTRQMTVLQLYGDGPFDIHYLDLADDPRLRK
ncbi:MAG: cupin domain-containing protein [Microvirgula sp.]